MSIIFGIHDENTLTQFKDVESRSVKAALLADGHVGYVMPIGGVAAYDNHVSVAGVGFDIACGNAAIKTDMQLSDLGKTPEKQNFMLNRYADDIARAISFGIGRSNVANDAPTDHALFESNEWHRLRERVGHGEARRLKDKARDQLGTVGSGNHYVDVFVDEDGFLWVGVHFGSRGFGHGIASGFLAIGQGKDWHDKVPEVEVLLNLNSSMGQDYWALMNLAGEYAYAGREWVARKVAEILGAKEVELIHNHHNFAWKETHDIVVKDVTSGEAVGLDRREVVVVRKGATPAFPGQKGFVGGSMGDVSVILEGTDDQKLFGKNMGHDHTTAYRMGLWYTQSMALYSTVHGAGRVMSRTEAKGKVNRKTGQLKLNDAGEPVKTPKVTHDMMREWLKKQSVILRGGGVDESPHVYRRLPDVLASQQNTITVLHTLTPLVVVMAGENEFDPYKD